MIIRVYDNVGQRTLGDFTYYEGLTFDTVIHGGFTVASFEVHRKVNVYWDDLQPFNWVEVVEGSDNLWEGYVDSVERTIKPDTLNVTCLGWSALLNNCGTTDDILAGGGGYQASTFITDVILADSDVSAFVAKGDVETDDYSFPNGTRFEFSPWTSYFDCLEQFMPADTYRWGIWEGRRFDLVPKRTTADWYVYVEDCDDLTIAPNMERYCNQVVVSYTQDSVHQQTTTRTLTTSPDYGRTVTHLISVPGRVTTAAAQQIGDTYLGERDTVRVAAELTCKRVFNSRGAVSELALPRAGEVVRLVNWLPTEELISSYPDDISTFEIKSTSYNHAEGSLRITPTEFVSQVEVQMARLQATGY